MSVHGQNNPGNPTQGRDSADAGPHALDALLRQSPFPEPSPWFAARTLARLRNDLHARPFSLGFPLWVRPRPLLRPTWAPRLARVLACFLLVFLGILGFHLKAERDNRQLTFQALALAAQGETPFSDEETPWSDGAF